MLEIAETLSCLCHYVFAFSLSPPTRLTPIPFPPIFLSSITTCCIFTPKLALKVLLTSYCTVYVKYTERRSSHVSGSNEIQNSTTSGRRPSSWSKTGTHIYIYTLSKIKLTDQPTNQTPILVVMYTSHFLYRCLIYVIFARSSSRAASFELVKDAHVACEARSGDNGRVRGLIHPPHLAVMAETYVAYLTCL